MNPLELVKRIKWKFSNKLDEMGVSGKTQIKFIFENAINDVLAEILEEENTILGEEMPIPPERKRK